jgi:endonuclease YncB( thermonuclease family)
VIDVDRYHREVGRILLGERFINVEMVADGFDPAASVFELLGRQIRNRSGRMSASESRS